MELYKPSANLFLDCRKEKANGKCPLKLTVYYNGDKKRYRIGIDLTLVQWQRINGDRLKDNNLKEIKLKVNTILARAEKVFDKISPFSFTTFESIFFNAPLTKIELSLEYWFREYGKILESEGREGTRISYNTTYNSFNNFKKNLQLPDITKQFLLDYELHMSKSGKSSSTIGIYLRQLRAIINRAIANGALNRDAYPFRGFQIPTARNIKKALCDHDLELLLNYKPKNLRQRKALDFWVFSFLNNGMNFTDILHLSPTSINENFLFFTRQKTKRTRKKDLRQIKVALHDRAKKIIEKWKSKDPNNPFLFPILEAGLTPKTTKHRIQKFIKFVNASMDEIRCELKIADRVGTYVARHSFCTRLMRKGVPTQYIKDSLGHSSAIITESYLGDFADNVKQEYAILLTDFS